MRDIAAVPAIFPRLGLTLECGFASLAKEGKSPETRDFDYELRDLIGELRLEERSNTVGAVHWTGPRSHVRSSPWGQKCPVTLACDLDAIRLERIEQRRQGDLLMLWLELWPTLVAPTGFLNGHLSVIRLEISRDSWLTFLNGVGWGRYEVIELRFSDEHAGQFRAAVEHMRNSRERILHGDYDGAIVLCRKAIEALKSELSAGTGTDPLQSALQRGTSDRRATEYQGMISRFKTLLSLAAHDMGSQSAYSRPEALFLLRTTENLVGLIAALGYAPTRAGAHDPGPHGG